MTEYAAQHPQKHVADNEPENLREIDAGTYRGLVLAARDLLAACRLGDCLGYDGPSLLEYVADLIRRFAPVSASELQRKAAAERTAIAKVEALL